MKTILPPSTIIYQPAEDTFLLQKHIKEHAQGTVLEIGTGSGILAQEAAASDKVKSVLAVDIQAGVIDFCKKTIQDKKITFLQSNLFSSLHNSSLHNKSLTSAASRRDLFDCIIFNPPYLPGEPRAPDITLDGGKKGWEVIVEFLEQAPNYLQPEGIILLLFSSFSKKEIIDKTIQKKLLEAAKLDEQHISFETLYIYKIKKTELLKEMEEENLTQLSYLAKGKRGYVYTAQYKNKMVIVKAENPDVKAPSTILFEAKWLQKMNKNKIGPKFFFAKENFLMMEYIVGELFLEYLEKRTKKEILKMIQEVFSQMYALDTLGVSKKEMTHPHKHIIIRDNVPYLIDFERCRATEDPKNVTQFLQFITSFQVKVHLEKKGIHLDKEKMMRLAKEYKDKRTKEKYESIVSLLK